MVWRQNIRAHLWAIVLALVTALIVAFPQAWFRIDHRSDGIYQGIELLPDSPWSARAREVMDGHPNLGAIYYADGKDDPYLFQPLGSMTVAYLGEVFGLDINDTILLSRIVLPFLVFLLVYALVFFLSGSRLVALAGAALVLLGDPALSLFGVKELLHGVSPDSFLKLSRPVNPAAVYLYLFGFLAAFWQFFKRRNWWWGVASAILLGLNFYNYFYSWSFLYAFGGVLTLVLLIKKQWREAFRIVVVFAGALVVAIPYALNLHQAMQHPGYAEASVRFGVIASHAPVFVGFLAIAAFIAFFVGFPERDKERWLFGLALLLTPLVTMNQQLITGKVLQASHYHWFMHKPIAVIFAIIVLFALLAKSRFRAYRKPLAVLIVGASVAVGAFVQVYCYYHGTNDGGAVAVERQKYGPVVRWLDENTPRESVVIANNEVSHLVAIYTSDNVFYHRAAMYALAATTERLEDVLFTFYRLRGVGKEDAKQVFYDEREEVSANIYGMHYRQVDGAYAAIPDEKLDEIVAHYSETLATPTAAWLKQTLAKYGVGYVIWDKKADPLWKLDSYSFLKEGAVFGDIAVYRFNP